MDFDGLMSMSHLDLVSKVQELEAELDKWRREATKISELREDKERLDWCDRYMPTVVTHKNGVEITVGLFQEPLAPTWREAIDKAKKEISDES